MAKKKAGRHKEYKTADALHKAVESYWKSISYQVPVAVSVPTDEVDKDGKTVFETKLLYVDDEGVMNTEGQGSRKLTTVYLEPPCVAGLCLYLGISKTTWCNYAKNEELGIVCERFRLRHESYNAALLESSNGKSVQGVIFNMKNNFDWTDKRENKDDAGEVQIIDDL